MKSFLDQYQSFGIKPYGVMFFTPDIALGIIDEAEGAGIHILGIDGFTVTLKHRQPTMEHSIDLSNLPGNRWLLAREFISKRRNLGLLFEFTLDE